MIAIDMNVWQKSRTRDSRSAIETVERFVEHSDDVRVSTLRQYLEAFDARLA